MTSSFLYWKDFLHFKHLKHLRQGASVISDIFDGPVQSNLINTFNNTILAQFKPDLILSPSHFKPLLATVREKWTIYESFYGAWVNDIGLNLRAYAFFYLISAVFVIID